MNKQLRTFITMLLLCLFGATDGWSQSDLANVYTNNLDFLSSSEYIGTMRKYKIGAFSETTYTNGILSFPVGQGVRTTNTISFMVPAGTRYLHFHVMGGNTNANFKVESGGTTYSQSLYLPNGTSIIDTEATTSRVLVFNQSPGESYYKRVDFYTLLEQNSLEQNSKITITTQGEDNAFMIFGVNYEDEYSPHKGAERNPFTADEVYSLITDHVQPTNKVYVKGKVSTAVLLTSATDRSATFYFSEDATHTNEILVDKTYSFDSQNFANANQVLPRDKVTLYCNIKVEEQSLTNGKFIQQVHPTYAAIVRNGNTPTPIRMTSGASGGNYADYPIHSCDVHLSAGEASFFYFEESYSDDLTSTKTFRGPYDPTGYYTLTWANHNNIQLTEGTEGGLMNVDSEGDYTLYVKQVEDGPQLDISGFPYLSYSLCYKPDLDGENVETPFYDNGDGTFTLTDEDLDWGQAFWIIRDFNGEKTRYGDAKDNLRIHRYNSSDIQLSPYGWDYLLLGQGALTFTITETTDGPKLRITGWPTPVFHVLNLNGEVTQASFQKQNDGSYTTMFTITEEEIGEQFAFVIYDSANDVNLGVDIDSMYVGNLSGQPVQLKTEDNCSMKLTTAGTYYMTLNPDMMLTVTKLNMTNFITNGDIEGEDMSCFFKQEPISIDDSGSILPATFTAGAGVDGSRGIVVNTIDNAAANLWDAAFFVRLTEALPEGTKYRISFDCKASQATNVTTNIHAEPGTFLYWNGIGDVNFTTEWQHIERMGIVTSAQSPNGEMQTIAFLLSENKSATSFYFDNIVIEADLPVPEPEPTMMSVVKNGNIEGSDMSCFFKQEPIDEETTGDIVPATFTAGAGVDGSRGIVVNTIDKPNAEAWDAHFFIRLTQALPEGTKYRISFDYKASQETYVTTNIHAEPGTFLVWNAFGSMNFTTEWQHIEWTGTVTSDLSPDDNMRTIVFLLYYGKKTATSFYFDNINVEIDEDHYVYQRGDANGDGNVTIADVVTIVDYTLGKASPTFVESAADLNNDGQINVSDVVALVNILLGKDSQ